MIGAADGACPLFLAARGAEVTVADADLTAVLSLEQRAMAEALRGRIECEVVSLGGFAPRPGGFVGCVLEPSALADLSARDRGGLIARLKDATPNGGRHVVMPGLPSRGAAAVLSSDTLRSQYGDWEVFEIESVGRSRRNAGFIAVRRAQRRSETPMAVSN